MAVILDLETQRRHLAAKKGFRNWHRHFPESFDEATSLRDLSDPTLAALIQGGEEASMPLYELVMGVLGLGAGPRFYDLENAAKMEVMDIVLFLLDQLRFEAMRRLGWIEEPFCSHIPLVDLVGRYSSHFASLKHQTPPLAPTHFLYKAYQETFEGDQAAFIRRLIPEALQLFQEREQKG